MPSVKRKADVRLETPSKKPKVSVPSRSNVSILSAEEPSFPRGGASILTPLEHKQISLRAKEDALFEQNTGKSADMFDSEDGESGKDLSYKGDATFKARRKSTKSDRGGKISKLDHDTIIKVEGLSYKRLVPGSLVLGQVCRINRSDIALALPNNLTGYIPITAISDRVTEDVEALAADDASIDGLDSDSRTQDYDLNTIVSVGQYLRAYVSSTNVSTSVGAKGKKHIELSINPKQANSGLSKSALVVSSMVQATVTSVEDHGVVMSLGLEDTNIRGFMGSKEIGNTRQYSELKEGAVYLCLITGLSSNGKVVKLSANSERIGSIKKGNFLTDAPTVDSFLPGTAVELLVSAVTSSGILGKVMGVLDVTADVIQSGAAASSKPMDKKYPLGSKVKARILCTFPTSGEKKLGVSMLDHVLALSVPCLKEVSAHLHPIDTLPISSIVEQARVVRVEPGLGVFVDLGVKGFRGFAHISHLSDKKVETLFESSGPYKTGSIHRARIIGYNPMDGLFLVSFEQRVLDLPFLRLEDVGVGQVVKGTVEKLVVNAGGVGGVIICITEGISGLVPEMHLADVHLQHPEKKFKEGLSVTGRVLSIDLERRRMRLTLKKTLVNSDVPVWKSYEKLAVGMEAPGTLVNLSSAGAVVQFYGQVRGFLPVAQMSDSFIKDPTQHFRLGQVVNVNITSVSALEKRMIVSCRDPSDTEMSKWKTLGEIVPGATVEGLVTEKTADEILVEIASSGRKAHLLLEHLSDGSAAKCLQIAKRIRVGQKIKDLLVLDKDEAKHFVRLTSKPSLIQANQDGNLPSGMEHLTIGATIPGFVKNIISTGIFVQFLGGLTGFLPASHLSSDTSKIADFGMRVHQSTSARVFSIDSIQGRFTLSQKVIVESYGPSSGLDAYDRALTNPVDGTSTSIDDFTLGKLTKAKIISIKETQMNVQLADRVQGRIDVSQAFDSWDDIKDRKHPLKSFNAKQVVPVRILGVHDSRNHRFLPITHSNKAPVFELSAKPMDQTETELDVLTIDKIGVDSSWLVFVNNVGDDCLWVNLSPNVRGRIRAMDVSEDVSLLADLAKNFPIGSALRARVLHVDPANNRLDLSARSGTSSTPTTIKDLTEGMVLPGRVTKITQRYVMVQLSEHISGSLNLIDMADDYDAANTTSFQKNQTIRVCILNLDIPNKRLTLSARPSKVLSSSLNVKDPEIRSISQLKINEIVRGFVKSVADNGLFVSLASHITAYVRITDLSDSFIKDWKSTFEIDQIVTGKIIAVDSLLNHVQMSLKQSVLDKDYQAPATYADMHVGRIVTGKIRKVEDFGVFILVDGSSNVSGLCHRSEMADEKIADVRKLFDEGDAVKAKVLKVEPEKRRISFGLKASYFTAETSGSELDEGESAGIDGVERCSVTHNDFQREDLGNLSAGSDDLKDVRSIGSSGDGEIEQGIDAESHPVIGDSVQGLKTNGFDWSGGLVLSSKANVGSDTDGGVQPTKKKRKRAGITVDKTGDLDTNGPQSVADFERLLMGQPNSSYLWLSYMAFQLQLNEVLKARDIAERAIRTINQSIDTESEILNVWVAYLNLENTYGNDGTLEEIFRRACEHNDPEEMHSRLASIYIQSGNHEKANDLLHTMTKKFSQDPKIWLNYATFLFDIKAAPANARDLLPRAMQSLPKHHHLDLTSKFAQLEFRSANGDSERGRTIFEGLISTFPKRLDVWNVFLDLEINAGDKDQARRLFERVTACKLKAKKAKFFFKRWLEFEEKNGDAQRCEMVTARASEYVRQRSFEKI
ncbi:rRNA biogenesis protein rrp5 [Lambiella insularis]|nr:rRNA biogenesis protein rrp5 [Lambiella insularis]